MRPFPLLSRAGPLLPASLLAVFLPQVAAATLMRPLPVEEMARHADLVVRARTLDVRVEWSAASAMPITFARLEILEVLHGAPPSSDLIEVAQAGGTMDGRTLDYDGRPRFLPGEETVTFLIRRGTRFTVLGLAQGKFAVGAADHQGRRRLERRLDGIELMAPGGAPAPRPPADLEALRGTLRALPRAVAGGPGRSTP